MEIKDSYELPLPKERVWAALNDEEFLKKSIPWCEKLERRSETELAAEVKLKIGPMSTRFTGSITLSDIDPPNGYTITGSGKGGIAGAASGSAKVRLLEAKDPSSTTLSYEVSAQVKGKIAQLGSRLIKVQRKNYQKIFLVALFRSLKI